MMNYLNIPFTKIFFLLIHLLPTLVYGSHLVGIVVANTLPYAENLGREHDVLKMIQELETISTETGLKLDLHAFIHEDYNSDLLNKLDNVIVGPEDVIFFYYSGHGSRGNDKDLIKNPWPNLHIGLEDKGIDFQDIIEVFKSKNPRLFLGFVNSCNKLTSLDMELVKRINFRDRLITSLLQSTDEVNTVLSAILKENYRQLFLDTSGVLISSSSKPGQFSYRKRDSGTLYLEAFLNSLHEQVESMNTPDWESIMAQTVNKTLQLSRGKQTPQYTVLMQKAL